jgi:hypothetical protein
MGVLTVRLVSETVPGGTGTTGVRLLFSLCFWYLGGEVAPSWGTCFGEIYGLERLPNTIFAEFR